MTGPIAGPSVIAGKTILIGDFCDFADMVSRR